MCSRQGHCWRGEGKYTTIGELKLILLDCTVMSKDYRLITNGAGKSRALETMLKSWKFV